MTWRSGSSTPASRDSASRPKTSPPARPADEDIVHAFFRAIGQTPPGDTLYVLASYTTLWTLRRELVERGYLAPFFRQAEVAGNAGNADNAGSVTR